MNIGQFQPHTSKLRQPEVHSFNRATTRAEQTSWIRHNTVRVHLLENSPTRKLPTPGPARKLENCPPPRPRTALETYPTQRSGALCAGRHRTSHPQRHRRVHQSLFIHPPSPTPTFLSCVLMCNMCQVQKKTIKKRGDAGLHVGVRVGKSRPWHARREGTGGRKLTRKLPTPTPESVENYPPPLLNILSYIWALTVGACIVLSMQCVYSAPRTLSCL